MEVLVEAYSSACDDVIEFPSQFPGWRHDIVQISGGRFGFSNRSIQLPGLTLARYRYRGHFALAEIHRPPVVSFRLLLSADKPLLSEGFELAKPHLILQKPGKQHSFVYGGATEELDIQVALYLVKELGWKLGPNRHFVVAGRNLDAFDEWSNFVFGLTSKKASLEQLLRVRGQTLQKLGKLLQSEGVVGVSRPGNGNSLRSAKNTFSHARAALLSVPFDEPLNIPGIASDLSLSERRLYRAFKQWVGVGPGRYFELMRLHALRSYLKSGQGKFESMSSSAERFGFSNAGRMALRYNQLFFELPSHTARRARKVSACTKTVASRQLKDTEAVRLHVNPV